MSDFFDRRKMTADILKNGGTNNWQTWQQRGRDPSMMPDYTGGPGYNFGPRIGNGIPAPITPVQGPYGIGEPAPPVMPADKYGVDALMNDVGITPAPDDTPPYSPDDTSISGTTFGNVMSGVGMVTGFPGLGMLGGAIGAGLDTKRANDTLAAMGEQPSVAWGPAFVDNLTFGLAGTPADEQAINSIEGNPDSQAQAAAEAAIGLDAFGGPGPATGNDGAGGGDGAKVICTALYDMGMLDRNTYMQDALAGMALAMSDPDAMAGYHLWAKPLARLMRKHPAVAKIIRPLAMPWARQIAGDENLIGKAYVAFGIPVCRAIGRLRRWFMPVLSGVPIKKLYAFAQL